MEVSSQTNNYQAINAYQKNVEAPVTLPVEPGQTVTSPEDVYKASNGNVISDQSGNISLTPQGQLNASNAQSAQDTAKAEETQAQKDAKRGIAVDYTASQSKKSQVEIAMAVASDDSSTNSAMNETATIVESLRDVQKQNNVVQAYATYKENQNAGQLGLVA